MGFRFRIIAFSRIVRVASLSLALPRGTLRCGHICRRVGIALRTRLEGFPTFPPFPPVVFTRQRRVAGTARIPDAPARRHPVRQERGVVTFEPSTRLTMAPILLPGCGEPYAELK